MTLRIRPFLFAVTRRRKAKTMSCTIRSLILFAALISAGAATRESLAQIPENCTQTDNIIKSYTPLSKCIVPGPNRDVVITPGGGGRDPDPCTNVYVDKNYVGADALGKIDIKAGATLYARDTTSTIEATSIIVGGTFQAGTASCPVGKLTATNKFTVRLLGTKPAAVPAPTVHVHDMSVVCSDVPKGIGVMANGSLRMYGARGIAPANRDSSGVGRDSSGVGPNPGSLSWTYLARAAGTGRIPDVAQEHQVAGRPWRPAGDCRSGRRHKGLAER